MNNYESRTIDSFTRSRRVEMYVHVQILQFDEKLTNHGKM